MRHVLTKIERARRRRTAATAAGQIDALHVLNEPFSVDELRDRIAATIAS